MVHKDYQERISPNVGANDSNPVTTRLSGEELAALRLFAIAEGETVSRIVREGVLRAIDARKNDAEYIAALPEAVKSAEAAHQALIDAALSSLEN